MAPAELVTTRLKAEPESPAATLLTLKVSVSTPEYLAPSLIFVPNLSHWYARLVSPAALARNIAVCPSNHVPDCGWFGLRGRPSFRYSLVKRGGVTVVAGFSATIKARSPGTLLIMVRLFVKSV